MIEFPCPHCGVNISAESEYAGASANCPTCEQYLVVPEAPRGSIEELPSETVAYENLSSKEIKIEDSKKGIEIDLSKAAITRKLSSVVTKLEGVIPTLEAFPRQVRAVIPYALLLLGLGHISTWLLPDGSLHSSPLTALFILAIPALLLTYLCGSYAVGWDKPATKFCVASFLFTAILGVIALLLVQTIGAYFLEANFKRGPGRFVIFQAFFKAVGWLYTAIESPSYFIRLVGYVFGVGLLEEVVKVLPLVIYILWAKNNSSRDTIRIGQFLLIGLFSGLGFGFTEAIFFYSPWSGNISSDSNIIRWYACVPSHALYTVVDAIVLWRLRPEIEKAKTFFEASSLVAVACLLVAVVHGVYNSLASIGIMGFFMDAISIVILAYLLKYIFGYENERSSPAEASTANKGWPYAQITSWFKNKDQKGLRFAAISLVPLLIVSLILRTPYDGINGYFGADSEHANNGLDYNPAAAYGLEMDSDLYFGYLIFYDLGSQLNRRLSYAEASNMLSNSPSFDMFSDEVKRWNIDAMLDGNYQRPSKVRNLDSSRFSTSDMTKSNTY